MKAIASILIFYLFGLFVQPTLFPLHQPEAKKMSCCAQKENRHKDCSGSDDGCCGGDQCNPFFSSCPICAANALTMEKYMLSEKKPAFSFSRQFFLTDDRRVCDYQSDILHPPQTV